MTPAFLPVSLLLAGAAGLAGVLALLHVLRVRHREREVITMLFWREAIDESMARRWWQRFRHPWAYLLALAILWSLWGAMAGLQRAGAEDGETVFILDGVNVEDARFTESCDALLDHVRAFGAAPRRVMWCGDGVRLLLDRDEPPALLERRLAELAPVAGAGHVDVALRQLADVEPALRRIVIVGDGVVRAETLGRLEDVLIERVELPGTPPARIESLEIAESASGRWDAVDVRGVVSGTGPRSVRLDGDVLPAIETELADGRIALDVRDVPARGGRVQLSIGDRETAIALPRREPVKVAVEATVPAIVRAIVAADPGLTLDSEDPRVIIAVSAGPGPRLVIDERKSASMRFTAAEESSRSELADALENIGLQDIGAAASEGPALQVDFLIEAGSPRRADWSADLLAEPFDLMHAQALPIAIARTVRWLAGVAPTFEAPNVGRPLGDEYAAWRDEAGVEYASTGAPFVPVTAGSYTSATGSTVLVSATQYAGEDRAASLSVAERERHASLDAASGFGMLAFILLVLEWFLYRRERMP